MKSKFTLLMVSAALVFLTGQVAAKSGFKGTPAKRMELGKPANSRAGLTQAAPALQNTKSVRRAGPVFTPEKNLSGEHIYIVQLAAAPLASYRGGVAGYAATDARYVAAQRGQSRGTKLDINSRAAEAYKGYLRARHVDFRLSANRALGREPKQTRSYFYSFNGLTLSMTQAEALEVAKLPGVVRVTRDRAHKLLTDRGPTFIGADSLWDGTALENIGTMGEGVLVGIMDTGINGDHPSFKATGEDGYTHVNPFGEGNYKGECFATAELVCNSKLVGRHNMTSDPDSEDTQGHGSHVASTAAGNVRGEQELLDAEGAGLAIIMSAQSGVAPHANIIAYKVCREDGCFTVDVIAAVEQAIIDGVDVLNHSIGSASGSPWNEPKALSFKAARAAGISLANSVGNSGPEPGGDNGTGSAPWGSSVAASTHDRAIPDQVLTLSGGGTPPAAVSGAGITLGYEGPIVYAGDYANPNDPSGDPAQCLQPFPAGTFNGEIVLCDRGAIARVQKAINVRDGGAAGFILCNVEGGDEFLADDPHVIPGIHLSVEACRPVREWLAQGSGHTGVISGTSPAIIPEEGDIMAGFSSRGPYPGFDFLAPSMSAPGVNIFAAWRDPEQVSMISGTSMSSPHVAGALALLTAAHSDWTDAEIMSALVTTGNTNMREEDAELGLRQADAHDYGGGRIQLQHAAAAGLVLDEIDQNFDAANPAIGGDPRALNMPWLYDSECLGTCSFTRTVRATTAGTWTLNSVSDYAVVTTMEPASFTLAAGETQALRFTVSVAGIDPNQWVFGHARLTHNGSAPVTTLPVVVHVAAAIFPDKIEMTADRDTGSAVGGGIRTAETSGLEIDAFGVAVPETRSLEISGSVGDFTPYTDTATKVEFYSVPAGSVMFMADTIASTAPDVDMFVGKDSNQDREITPDEELCASGNPDSVESCLLNEDQLAGGGIFWVALINFEGSGDGIVDTTDLQVSVISPSPDGSITAEVPTGVGPGEPFDVRVLWDFPMTVGVTYLGAVKLTAPNGALGLIPVEITRAEDDVKLLTSATSANVGDIITFDVEVSANMSFEDRNYVVDAAIPAGLELVAGSVTGGAQSFVINDNIIWLVDQPSLTLIGRTYRPTINGPGVDSTNPMYDATCDTGFSGYVDLDALGFDLDPSISGNNVVFDVLTEQRISLYGEERNGGIHLTDDGFVFFNSQPGAAPGSNTAIPNPAMPNDMAAVLWSDMEIVYDPVNVGGVTVAAGGANLSVVEYDNMQRAPAGSSSSRIDFEMLITGVVNDDLGKYELIYAFDNIDGDWSDATIGVENTAGTKGTQFHGELSDGLMICWDYRMQPTDPTVLSFQARVLPSASGGEIIQDVHNIVDTQGAREVVESATISVAEADSDSDGVGDALDNCSLAHNPDQRDTDNDGFGNLCDGDFTQDGIVNTADLTFLIQRFNTEDPDADLNGSGFVDYNDVRVFKNLWLRVPGPSGLN